jgi:tetratricopeptide (TPR) repeat protein
MNAADNDPGSDGVIALFTPDELGLDEPTRYSEVEDRFNRIAAEANAAGDVPRSGWAAIFGVALLGVAWAMEKQGRWSEALEQAEASRDVLRKNDELKWLAEVCHSIGVWKFHNLNSDPPVEDFTEAIKARIAIGDLMAAAQSWHNLGYVQLIAGRDSDADASYERAAELLTQVQAGSDRDLAETAFRQLGFVLSHQAYAAARHRPVAEALRRTSMYFEHAAQTGAHREPVLAYLAPGIALASSPEVPEPEGSALSDLVGIAPDAETWLRVAVREASAAMTSHANTGTGYHAYLGSHLLALAELARWCSANGRHEEAEQLVAQALSLARARGWAGEASRIEDLSAATAREEADSVTRVPERRS